MIPRILVPRDLRFPPPDSAAKPCRQSSTMDARIVVPGDLPVRPIDPKSKIPSQVPLDVISSRTLVARDMPAKPFVDLRQIPDFVPLTILDMRVVIPAGLEPGELESHEPLPPEIFEDVVQGDVITTGEVQLLGKPEGEHGSDWNQVSRFGSLIVHAAMIVFIIFLPKIFPPHVPTRAEQEMARRQLSFVYLPPSVDDVPKVAPSPEPPSAKMRIDPRVLHQVAPPEVQPTPLAGPPREAPPEQPNLPAAPTPQVPVQRQMTQNQSAPERPQPEPHASPLQNVPATPVPSNSLALPRLSPGKALEETMKDALHGGGPTTGGFADPLPQQGPGGGGGGGGGQGLLGGNLEMLTPTEGVDFSNYLARLLAGVRRNWYAVIPESARLGERGRVILQFRITREGNVPFPEPNLVRTSGKEPLDRAAMAAIRASNPFEPLPPAFSGPYIELRFTFLYNLPLNSQ